MAEYEEDASKNDDFQIQEDISNYKGGGFIKIFRKFSEWEWYTDSQAVHLFLHILLHANHKTKNWQGQTVHRGQLVTSINKLSLATGISQKAVRLRLKKFEKSGEITTKGANRFTLISICKYSEYQESLTQEGQTKGKQRANKGQTKGDKQECKEGKERKEVYSDNSDEKSAPPWREKFAPEVVEFVEQFQGYVAQTQGAKAPKVSGTLLETCADTVDKLIRIDKHSLTTMVDVMRWAVADEFWSSNVLSLASLRKKKEAGGQTKFQKILAAYERTSVTSSDVLNEMVRRVEGGKRTEAEGVCADIKTIATHSGTGTARHTGTEADPGDCGTLVGGGRAQAGGNLDSW